MSDHSQEAKDAAKAFKEEGRAIVLRTYTKTGSSYDPILKPNDSAPVYALQTKAKKYEYDRGLVTATSKVLLVESTIPITKDMKVIDGSELSITSLEPLQLGDDVIFYRVMVDG